MTATVDGIASGKSASPAKSARVASIWLALGLLAGVFSVFHDASHLYDRAQRDTDRGSLGATFDNFCRTDGFCAATKVAPGGPIALVGMRDGDSVRFDHSYDFNRVLRVGETVGFTLEHEGVLSHHTVTARSRPPLPPARLITSYLLNALYILTSLVGLLVLLRSRRRAAALLLGAGLACLGLSGTYPSLLESDPRIFPAFLCLVTLVFIAPPILFLGFALAARHEIGKSVGRPWTAVLIAYSTAQIITGVYQAWEILSARIAPGIGVAFAFSDAMQDLGYLLCFLVLAAAWRVSGATSARASPSCWSPRSF
jgi:hypothetical protein